jgi:antitoxin MazE
MEISVIKIGNSKGIRFSKTLLEKYNIRDTVDLIMEKGQIIIKPLFKPRKGWEKAFKEMNENGDDKLLINDIFNEESLEEWK